MTAAVDAVAAPPAALAVLTGPVVRGDARGRAIGFPTANLALPPEDLEPLRDGVYAARVVLGPDAGSRPGLACLGASPTFGGSERHLEVHVLDYRGDLYGRRVRVELHAHLADLERCASSAALTARIARLAAAARRRLGEERG